MPKGKKGGKAAFKKKTKAKTKQKTKDQGSETSSVRAPEEKRDDVHFVDDPDKKIKEFSRDIQISNLSVAPIGGGPPLIVSSDIKLIHGHRYGLIGPNGAGKTTLLKKLAGGSLKEIPNYLRVLHVHQELNGSELSVLETVLKSDTERERLLTEERRAKQELEDLGKTDDSKKATKMDDESLVKESDHDFEKVERLTNRIHEIGERLKFIEADKAEARASSVLDGLQFTDRMKNMKTSDLSGGWLMRVSLACALFVEPDVLLLDEPTNHLDFPSVIWLAEYLQFEYNPAKIVMIVSHDRRFLNDICTDIIHLEHCRLVTYKGNYDSFMEVRKQRRIHTRKQYEKQQKMIKHNEDFIQRFKANKKWSTQAQSRQKMMSKMTRIQKVLDDLEFRFYFPDPPLLKNPSLLRFTDVSFGYFGEDPTGKSYLLQNVQLRLEMGTKVGILGANGAGKSTLVRLIMNEISPMNGTCFLSNESSIGYFAQHHMETLDFNATPLEHLKNVFGTATQQEIYAQLGRFSLGGDFARRKIGTLSGGQKARVAFAILTWYSPHLVIMDEPTNHLDLQTIDALAAALAAALIDFKGSVILVSHDQHFVEAVCDEFWAVGNRTVTTFDDFEQCRNFCFKKCTPVDVLPREFSTIETKKRKYNPLTESAKVELGLAEKIVTKAEKEKPIGIAADVFSIDPEREIDKGLAKGLTPDQILRHLKGWHAKDGSFLIVNKIGFIMFNRYFDKDHVDIAPIEYFAEWKNLVNYCIPLDHTKNQIKFVETAHACWKVAFSDENPRVKDKPYSFGMMLETLFRNNMINRQSVEGWKNENESKAHEEALKDISTFFVALDDEQNQSDSSDDDDSS